MTDRDKLIELYEKAVEEYEKTNKAQFRKSFICDYFLANGVIVPPCKVGDTVYYIINKTIQEMKVLDIKIYGNNYIVANANCLDECEMCDSSCDCSKKTCSVWVDFKSLGKTVFLTKEQAEEKLKELGKDD